MSFRQRAAKQVAAEQDVNHTSLYMWRRQLLNKGEKQSVAKRAKEIDSHNQQELIDERDALKAEAQKLQMEHDILLGPLKS